MRTKSIIEPTDSIPHRTVFEAAPCIGNAAMASTIGLTVFAAAVEARLRGCDLCPWNCRVDRLAGEQGVCRLGRDARIFFAGVEHAEEPAWINPTFSVYTAGCNMRCAFCAAGEHVVRPGVAPQDDVASAVRAFERAARESAIRSVSFCGGEPGVALATVLDVARALPANLPLVWNSNLYLAPDLIPALAGVFDLFLPDLHFGNPSCAGAVAAVPDYVEAVRANLLLLAKTGAPMRVRHLLRPDHLDCCFLPSAKWTAANLKGVSFDLLAGYTPSHRAMRAESDRRLTAREIEIANTWMVELGLASKPSDVTEAVIDADAGTASFWQSGDAAWATTRAMNGGLR